MRQLPRQCRLCFSLTGSRSSPDFSYGVGASGRGLEKIVLWQRFVSVHKVPRCRQSVARICWVLHVSRGGRWWPRLTAAKSPRTPAACCWGRPTGRLDWSGDLPDALATAGRPSWSSTRSARWSASASSGSRWATRTSSITTSRATIRSWRCWPASLWRGAGTARRWPANRRSTGWNWAAGRSPPITRSAMIRRQSRGRLSTSLSMPTQARRSRSSSISTPPTTRCTATRKGASSTAITTATAICRSTSSAAGICWRPSCAVPTSTRRPGRLRKWRGSSGRSAPAGRACASCCAPIWGLPATR